MPVVNVAVVGALGRMGRDLCALASNESDVRLVAAIVAPDSEYAGKNLSQVIPSLATLDLVLATSLDVLKEADAHVVVDFTTPEATLRCLGKCEDLGIPVVIGTTGLSDEQAAFVEAACSKIPLIHAMNYSLGVNILIGLCSQAAAAFGEDFDVEIVEAHHNKKADAPSGTALALADGILKETNRTRGDLVDGRSGRPGPRTKSEIGMHAVRMGAIVGDHQVHFCSQFENITLSHRALDRKLFASGALRAAKFLGEQSRKPGRYTMQDVLFSKE